MRRHSSTHLFFAAIRLNGPYERARSILAPVVGVFLAQAQRLRLHQPTLFTIVTERDHPTVNMLLG